MGAANSRPNVVSSSGGKDKTRRSGANPSHPPSSTSVPVRSTRCSVVTIGSVTSLRYRLAKSSTSSAPLNYPAEHTAPRMSITSSRTLKQTLLGLRRRRYTHDPSLLSTRDKLIINESWDEMRSRSINYIEGLIATAWLRAAENSPTWIWGLVGMSECQQAVQAVKNVQFRAIINGVRRFLHKLITDRNLNMDAIRYESAKLGERHCKYFEDGKQAVYWDSFVIALTAVIELSQCEIIEERKRSGDSDSRRRSRDSRSTSSSSRSSSASGSGDPSRTAYAWQKFIRILVDNMRAGYDGTFDYTTVSPLVFEMEDSRPRSANTECQSDSTSTSANCSPVVPRRQSRLKTLGRIDLARYIPDIHAVLERKRNKSRDG
uniref:Uncharacterized protein n=1 Tax=Plectus sambesii TaxID=2011161 RepID=A0A914WVM1_9BILA